MRLLIVLLTFWCTVLVQAQDVTIPASPDSTCSFKNITTTESEMLCRLKRKVVPPPAPPPPPIVTNNLTLTVAGGPNLPLDGTTALVTATTTGATPTTIALSRDGNPSFGLMAQQLDGTWTFVWCVSASCWGNAIGAHVLTAVATYPDGTTTSATSNLMVGTVIVTPPPSPPPTGPTFYAAPNGNDSQAGTSAAPWKTITKLIASLTAGQTGLLKDGTYEEGQLVFLTSGTASAPITLRAEHPGLAIISSTSGSQPGISAYASYITLDGLRLQVSPRNVNATTYTSSNAHIRAWEGSTNFVARNLILDATPYRDTAIKIAHANSLIENCVIHNELELFNVNRGIVRNNSVDTGGPNGTYILTKGGGRDIAIYNNTVRLTKPTSNGGILIGGSSGNQWTYDPSTGTEAYNVAVYNNIVINETGSPQTGLAMRGAKDSLFFNNIVVGAFLQMTLGGASGQLMPSNANPRFLNNLVTCQGGPSMGSWLYTGTVTVDYNNFFNCTSIPGQAHPVSGDPRFVSASDYHLQAGSPALGTGTAVTVVPFAGSALDVSKNKDGVTRTSPWNLGLY